MKNQTCPASSISNPIPESDLKLGAHGEDYVIRNTLTLFGCYVKEDRRKKNLEGELLLEDGRLVEVKADFTEYPLTRGTVAVEIANRRNAYNEGWYQCLNRNKVDLIAWTCFRKDEYDRPLRLPYAVLVVPLVYLIDFIENQRAFRRTGNPALISISIQSILGHCGSDAYLFRSMSPTDSDTRAKLVPSQSLKQLFLSKGLILGDKPSQIIFNDRTHSEEEDEEWVSYTPVHHESSIRRAHNTTQK